MLRFGFVISKHRHPRSHRFQQSFELTRTQPQTVIQLRVLRLRLRLLRLKHQLREFPLRVRLLLITPHNFLLRILLKLLLRRVLSILFLR